MNYTSITVYIHISISKYKYVIKPLRCLYDHENNTRKHHVYENMQSVYLIVLVLRLAV